MKEGRTYTKKDWIGDGNPNLNKTRFRILYDEEEIEEINKLLTED